VAVEASEHGASVYPVGPSGHLGRPWEVEAPGGVWGSEVSVTLNSRGRIAVGILYQDETERASSLYHGGPGCCLRVAIASWQLGRKPPAAEALSPTQDAETGSMHHALCAPRLVIGRSAITAIWTIGTEKEQDGFSGPGEVQIEQAYGRFGAPLHTARLFAAPKGVAVTNLSLEPDGVPVASWLDDRDKLHTVTGSHTGALRRPTLVQRAPQLSRPVGFTNDDEGDTIFSYFSRSSRNTSELRYMTSHDGGQFTRPRGIGFAGPEIPVATVVAGGHRTLLAFWNCIGNEPVCTEHAKVGTVSGILRSFPPSGSEGFVDSSGRAVIMAPTENGMYATTVAPGEPFTVPRRFADLPPSFDFGTGADEEPPLPTSPNGHAILYFTNDYAGEQYLVRYTP
jgi:hypothetical protein